MPKLKTNRSVAKRMRVTKSGRVKRFRPSRSHLLTSKRSKRKRHLGRGTYAVKGQEQMLHKILPYGV
jgi:large subunit ribosomal protein L35